MSKESKGGADYRSMVIRYRPVHRFMVLAGLVLFIILLVAVAFRMGGAVREHNYQQLLEQKAELALLVTELDAALKNNEQMVVNAQVAGKVDRLALEDLRQTIKALQNKVASLSEENTFYKGLMAPSELEKGLSLRGWEVQATADSQQFHFKLVVQQLALKHRLLYGSARVNISGKQNGKARTVSLHELSEDINNERVKLRFKYFQTIEGDLVLPEGFEPEQVSVSVAAVKPKSMKVEKSYVWKTH